MSMIQRNGKSKIHKQNQTILRQNHEIENLKEKISQLEINTTKKDDLTETLDNINTEWINLINELEDKRLEYERLFSDLKAIKNIMRNSRVKIPWYKKIKNVSI